MEKKRLTKSIITDKNNRLIIYGEESFNWMSKSSKNSMAIIPANTMKIQANWISQGIENLEEVCFINNITQKKQIKR